jgi:ligand-binding sensor domain-containing protein
VRTFFLPLLFIFSTVTALSQDQNYSAFTMKDGLPSNMVYRCLEDNEGFLWIATDAGIVRFDGKHFQVFTTADGLPDNEVLAVVKENDGTIWVNCFKQVPAYYDNIQNRFVSPLPKVNPSTIQSPYVTALFILEDGGVLYLNNKEQVFKNRKLVPEKNNRPDLALGIKWTTDGSVIRLGYETRLSVSKQTFYKLVQQKDGIIIDSIQIGEAINGFLPAGLNGGNLYLFNGTVNKCFVYSDIKAGPLRFKLDSISLPASITNYSFTETSVYFLCASGKIYVYNKNTKQLEAVVAGDYLANSYLNDSKGNMWISTIDKGVVVYRKNPLSLVSLPLSFTHKNFISIAKKADGTILAGNYYGEVIESGKAKFIIHTLSKKIPSRQRKIIVKNNKVFSFSEDGIKVNYGQSMLNKINGSPYVGKTAMIYNDTIILAGTPSGFVRINTITGSFDVLSTYRRVTSLARVSNGLIYFGSIDGLYRYDITMKVTTKILTGIPLLNERITSLCTTPDDILWVGTATNGIIGIRQEKVVGYITDSTGIVNNACRSIVAGKPGEFWVGTEQGISGVKYHFSGSKLKFYATNLSMSDGLTSNAINELLFDRDTLYAATANGISIIPASTEITHFDIPVRITNISINQRDTSIYKKYDLPMGSKNIQLRFGAIDLNGHFKNLEYSLDNNKSWVPLHDNFLNLELNYGDHILAVRAVDINGYVSKNMLVTEFSIATPYYKSIWFWVIVGIIFQVVSIYVVTKFMKTRKRSRLAKQIASVQNASLEQQAFTSLMNPHFMFNALNSVQHYINLQDRQNANRYLTDFASLIRKNFEAAQHSFIPLEQELENIRIYLRLEQMRFSGRFTYELNIEQNVDVEQWMIPTMMLQPLLENALLHGLMPSEINGNLVLSIKERTEYLEIAIIDNGIGIKNSSRSRENAIHKSRGMELIHKRIAALSHFAGQPISITMSPAFDSNTNPGNKIIILIPTELYPTWHKARVQGVSRV